MSDLYQLASHLLQRKVRANDDPDRHKQDLLDRERDYEFNPILVTCKPDDNGVFGDPTTTSTAEIIEFAYDIEVTIDGASKLQSEILPKVETAISNGIVSVFVDACKPNYRMLRSGQRSLEMTALDPIPSQVMREATCDASFPISPGNPCRRVSAGYSLYLDGLSETEAEATKKATMKIIEWNIEDGYLNAIDDSVVSVNYVGEMQDPLLLQGSITPDGPIQIPTYIIAVGAVGAAFVILIFCVACGRKKKPVSSKVAEQRIKS